jgi:hypothetical protein
VLCTLNFISAFYCTPEVIKVNFTIMVFNDFYRLLKEISTKEVMPEIRGSENISMDPKKMEMIHFSHIQQKSVIVTLNYIKLEVISCFVFKQHLSYNQGYFYVPTTKLPGHIVLPMSVIP